MADNLDLLFRVRGDASGAKNAIEQTRQAIAQLRDRIREVRAEKDTDIGFKKERIEALNTRLTELNQRHRAARDAAKQHADAVKQNADIHRDFESALGTLSPRLGNVAAALTGVVGPATAVAAASVAAAAGVALLGKAFVDLVVSTAAFQGKFFDLSQQVGVTVETLSTLDVIASTTGGNIESVTASLGIFQKNLEAAHDPTSKEAKLLTELGVTSLNTEVALRQVIKGLFELSDKQKQTAATLELFGRGGRFVNAILKESKGDLDAATAEFQRMGLVVSSESAVAADQFNDSLEILNRQLAAVTRNLVSQSIPAFIVFFEDINRAIQGNKAGWTSWADVIEFEVTVAIAAVESFAQFVASRGALGFFESFEANIRRIAQQSKELRGTLLAEGVAERVAGLTIGGRVGDLPGDGKKAAAEAEKRANKELALIQQALEERTRQHFLTLTRERDKDLKSIDEWEKESLELLETREQEQQEIFSREEANARRFIKNKEDLTLALIDIEQRRTKAVNQLVNEREKTQDDAQLRRDQKELETERQIAAIRDTARQIELDRTKDFVDRGVITESDGIARTLALLKDAQAQRLLLIDIELQQLTTSAARKLELDNEKIKSEQRYTDEFKRLVDERNRARESEEFEQGGRPGGGPRGEEIDFFKDIGLKIEEELGPPPEKNFDAWGDAFKTLGEIGRNALADLAYGVGSLIENWVLLGETGPKAMRKLVASVLAGVAAQAAVKAIYELAEGFAMLFVNPAAASAHFTSAAIFGSIAGVAAIAGRAVAGDAFQRNDSQGGLGTTGSGQLNPLTLNRNQPATIIVQLPAIQVNPNDRFGQAVTATWADDFTNGGVTREIIANDRR